MSERTIQDLQMLQALPLDLKISMTKARIREWVGQYGEEGVYVSFSGGKDSTVLLHIVREMYPDVPAVFVDTGLEYPEIRDFVKTFDNVTWVKPKMNFRKVIEKYGYPMISKEVSECVYGARKYLTKLMEDETVLDRQTDRQTDRRPPYAYRLEKLCGQGKFEKSNLGGTTTSTESSEESVCIRMGETHGGWEIPISRGKAQWSRYARLTGRLTRSEEVAEYP